jgi:hypothetical protein
MELDAHENDRQQTALGGEEINGSSDSKPKEANYASPHMREQVSRGPTVVQASMESAVCEEMSTEVVPASEEVAKHITTVINNADESESSSMQNEGTGIIKSSFLNS